MLRSTIDRIDAHWAERLGCAIEHLRAPHVTLITHGAVLASYDGVYALRPHDGGVVISSPPDTLTVLRAATRDRSPEHVFDAAFLARVLQVDPTSVIGPASLAYADSTTFTFASESREVRRLMPGDAAALAALRAACDEQAWSHGGIEADHDPIYAFFDGGAIVAAASWSPRGPIRHIGVITHPAHRGRGHARGVAGALAAAALDADAIPQWQTLIANAPSLAVGRGLGFVERYRSIAVRLA